jgi:hypothetical protein
VAVVEQAKQTQAAILTMQKLAVQASSSSKCHRLFMLCFRPA